MKLLPEIGTTGLVALFCCAAALILSLCLALHFRRMALDLRAELERQKASSEERVKQAREAVRAKSDFLSNMSHEIRTPLNAIIGMTQIGLRATTLEKAKACLDKAESSSQHLLGIINDILDFSKIEAGSLVLEERFFSLEKDIDFVTSMIKIKAKEKNIELRTKISEIGHDGIKTDMLRLNQVLVNLLSNAVKFTDPGGLVVLEAEELVHAQGESAYRFTVSDNGAGIEPDQAKKLFTPFTQANAGVARIYGGTGLGLAISQSIVQMMGGEIELETEPGKGSTFLFTIRVPAQEHADRQEEEDRPQNKENHLADKRILVVDDIEINREVVAGLLDGSGAIIEMAANGREALNAYLRSVEFRYDLVLMDMQMPVMDGCDATRGIRASGRADAKSIRIVAMTASVMREDVERAYAAGMDAYVAKPVDQKTLYRVLEEWL